MPFDIKSETFAPLVQMVHADCQEETVIPALQEYRATQDQPAQMVHVGYQEEMVIPVRKEMMAILVHREKTERPV